MRCSCRKAEPFTQFYGLMLFKNKSFPIRYVSILQRCICEILIALDEMNIPKRKLEYLEGTFVHISIQYVNISRQRLSRILTYECR